MAAKYHWLFFDLFDTLCWVDEEVYYEGKRGVAEALELDYEAFIKAWRSTSVEASVGKLKNPFERAQKALDLLGVDDRASAAEVARRDVETIQRCVKYYEGATDALDELRARGFRLGLISNATATTAFAVAPLRLRDHLDVLVFSYEVGAAKPDPAIFKSALARARCAPPEALFVGDGANRELDAAAELGIQPLCMNHPFKASTFRDPGTLSRPDFPCVPGFQALLSLVDLASPASS